MRKAALFLVLASLATTAGSAPGGKANKPKEILVAPPPMVRMPAPDEAPPTVPEDRIVASHRDWVVSDNDGYFVAYTTNQGKSALGVICGETCVFYLALQHVCIDGERYPAIINSKTGAGVVDLRCIFLDEDLPILSTDDAEPFIGVVRGGGEANVAVPLKTGRIVVLRFSLAGGVEAIDQAMDLADEKRKDAPGRLRDFTI